MSEVSATPAERTRNFMGDGFRSMEPGGIRRSFSTWTNMLDRCFLEDHPQAARYSLRGITVCAEWFLFANFLADMGARPLGLSLDRINNDKGYEPGNCRWATPTEQNRNTSRNQYVSIDGEQVLQCDVAAAYGLSEATIMRRRRQGLSGQELTDRAPRLQRKLTREQVTQIRLLIASGQNNSEIGRAFGVSHSSVRHIRIGATWSHYQ